MPIDDPVEVKEQYAREDNLRARQALWQGATGTDPKEVLWRTIAEWQPKRLLEVGGGQGELAERIQSELGANVTFLDLSPRMVELAQARGIDARQGDAQELPFADGTFDTVVAAWMLYHVPDVDRALAEFARVLVPGGALIAVTNSADHIAELRELVQHRESWSHTFSRENGERFLRRTSRRSSGMTPTWRCSSRAATRSSRIATPSRCRRARCRTTFLCRSSCTAGPRSSSRRHDPPGRADPAQARRRGAAGRRARRADARLRARRGARLPDGGVLHGRLLPRALAARDVRADRRDDPQRRDDRPRRGARAQGRRQALDRRRRRQDLARGRADRRRVRRARSGR